MKLRERIDALPRWIFAFVAAPLLALVTLSAWALASPVGSSPDDDFHLASIWCGAGLRDGLCEAGDDSSQRTVAKDLVVDSKCYADHPDVSASCQGRDFGDRPDDTVSTARGNFDGLYPPVFYFVMSAFAGPDIDSAVITMRIFNAIFFIAVIAGAYALLPRRRRPTLLWSVLITTVPLGVFLIASTNPSSWAILSAAVLWVTLLGYFETTGWRRIALGAYAALATVIGAGARADAAIYAIIAIGIACGIAFRLRLRFLPLLVLPAVLIVGAAVAYLSASQSGAASTGLTGAPPPDPETWRGLFLLNLANVPDLWVGVFGRWKLGWLDTPVPAGVWAAGFAVFVGAIAIQLRDRTARTAIGMAIALIAMAVIPVLILTQGGAVVGGYVQPRYILPLMVLLAGVALMRTPRTARTGMRPPSRVALVLAVLLLATANSLALHSDIRRYVTGVDALGADLGSNAEWWWSSAPGPMWIWAAGTGAFALLLVLAAAPLWRRSAEDAEEVTARIDESVGPATATRDAPPTAVAPQASGPVGI